jgi:hypothetical protein
MKNITPQLRSLAIPLSKVALDDNNARTHDKKNLEAIKASLRRFGQRLPIVVQEQGNIVRAGNGRVMAMRALGWSHVAAVLVDENDAEAAAFALADNRTAELADWDWKQLSQTLAELNVDIPDFDITDLGWDGSELEALQLTDFWDDQAVSDEHKDGKLPQSSGESVSFTDGQVSKIKASAERAGLEPSMAPKIIVQLCTLVFQTDEQES